ncbi:NADH:flavin oxidoreductase [Alteribacillus sp. HJP-4]|uniref:oxidoreductase n=1 Tax=Alteribacillus sp. HJP-4 TaxID=2775394 RepID=UPI0035CCF63A
MSDIDKLFEKGLIRGKALDNRYVVAPMTRVSAEEDGIANQRMKEYYERYAYGGFSAVITEGIYTDQKYSQGYAFQPGIANEEQKKAWEPIVNAVKRNGALFIAQLMHAGAQSQDNRFVSHTAAPSSIKPPGEQLAFYRGEGEFPEPVELTYQEIKELKEGFVQAALRSKNAGFDGVELHSANGYVLDQFLTEATNQRTDGYGGSLSERLKLLLEIIEEVREAVGEKFIVGVRISQAKVTDSEYRWPGGEEDASVIFSSLGKTSLDYIHTTENDGTAPGFGEGTLTMAGAAKQFSGLPVIANGQLAEPDKAAYLITNNDADFIALGTGALANPDAPNLIRKNKPLQEFDFEKIMLPVAYIKDTELKAALTK